MTNVAALYERTVRVGTRSSPLALAQTQWVCAWLSSKYPGVTVEVVRIRTTGDIRSNDPISAMAGRGIFVDAIEQSVLTGEIDFAVHSAKDLPARDAKGLCIAAYPPREDARDVLVCRDNCDLQSLPPEARVGTSSQRRASQISAVRPDLKVLEMRGNVDTRLRKVDEGEFDGIVLAAAGLLRLSLQHRISEWLSLDDFLPAPAQGALAVQVRDDDADLADAFSALNDAATSQAVGAERSFLARLGAGCTSPVAAYGTVRDSELTLGGFLHSRNGNTFRHKIVGPSDQGMSLGAALADHLTMLERAKDAP